MLDQKTKLATSVIRTGILTTFGKLNQDDIDAIDGQPERLVVQLVEHYGWKPDVAQQEVKKFFANLSTECGTSEVTPNAGDES